MGYRYTETVTPDPGFGDRWECTVTATCDGCGVELGTGGDRRPAAATTREIRAALGNARDKIMWRIRLVPGASADAQAVRCAACGRTRTHQDRPQAAPAPAAPERLTWGEAGRDDGTPYIVATPAGDVWRVELRVSVYGLRYARSVEAPGPAEARTVGDEWMRVAPAAAAAIRDAAAHNPTAANRFREACAQAAAW